MANTQGEAVEEAEAADADAAAIVAVIRAAKEDAEADQVARRLSRECASSSTRLKDAVMDKIAGLCILS